MDRPLGPRQPPDKRHTAYEDIFGRPGASHHTGGPSSNYPQPTQPYPYPYQPPPPDKRSSYSSLAPNYNVPSPQGPPSTYRQSYYPSVPHQAPHPHHPPYPQHIPSLYSYAGTAASSNPSLGHARSVISNSPINNGAPPRPGEPPDQNLEGLTQTGLTPAQAYQAQIYLNNPAGPQGDWNRFQNSPGPSNRAPYPPPQNGASAHPGDAPRLGVSLDHGGGRLGLDFGVGNGNLSDQGSDEDSELPWARTGAHITFCISDHYSTWVQCHNSKKQASPLVPPSTEE